MKINLQNIWRASITAALLVFGAAFTAQAQPRLISPSKAVNTNVVFKEKTFQVQITPNDLDSRLGLVLITGTGQLKLSGALTTANGCCARVKAIIFRHVTGASTSTSTTAVNDGSVRTIIFSETSSGITIFKEQTFETCGNQPVNLTANLDSNEDNSRFTVKIQNIDSWNKTTVSGNMTFRYPTADRILTGQPSIKFDLPQGLEGNRAFTLSPNTPGKLKVKVVFGGSTRVRVTLKKPNGSNARASVEGASGLEFTYDIADADITNGNTWMVNVLNLTDTPADNVDVSVVYTVDQ